MPSAALELVFSGRRLHSAAEILEHVRLGVVRGLEPEASSKGRRCGIELSRLGNDVGQFLESRPGPICASRLGCAVAGDRAFMRLQQYPSGKFRSAQPNPRRGGRAGVLQPWSNKGMHHSGSQLTPPQPRAFNIATSGRSTRATNTGQLDASAARAEPRRCSTGTSMRAMQPEFGLMHRRVPPDGTIDRHSPRLIGRGRRDRLVRISCGKTSKATSMAIAISNRSIVTTVSRSSN